MLEGEKHFGAWRRREVWSGEEREIVALLVRCCRACVNVCVSHLEGLYLSTHSLSSMLPPFCTVADSPRPVPTVGAYVK